MGAPERLLNGLIIGYSSDTGLICPSNTCDYIIKDWVKLEEETEPINEMEND